MLSSKPKIWQPCRDARGPNLDAKTLYSADAFQPLARLLVRPRGLSFGLADLLGGRGSTVALVQHLVAQRFYVALASERA
jgi:hypothetical protein